MAYKEWTEGEILVSSDINTNFTDEVMPIGSIIPWCKSFTGVPSIPDRFLECDGSVISDADSPLDGETLPDLLDPQSFLRGDTTSGGVVGSDTHTHTISGTTTTNTQTQTQDSVGGNVSVGAHNHSYSGSSDSGSSLPVYYEVVWIMRIK